MEKPKIIQLPITPLPTEQQHDPQQPKKEGKLLQFPKKHQTRRWWFIPGI